MVSLCGRGRGTRGGGWSWVHPGAANRQQLPAAAGGFKPQIPEYADPLAPSLAGVKSPRGWFVGTGRGEAASTMAQLWYHWPRLGWAPHQQSHVMQGEEGTSTAQHHSSVPLPPAEPGHPPASSPTCRLWVPLFNFSLQTTARS